jgi:hypothetical protein
MYRPPVERMRPLGSARRKPSLRRPWEDVQTAWRIRAERAHARRLGRARRARARAMLRLAS